MVRWLVNGQIKDEEYEKNAGDVIENRYAFTPFPRPSREYKGLDLNNFCISVHRYLCDFLPFL